MKPKDLTIIVPTFDSEKYLESLHKSIVESPLVERILKIIYICDGVVDGTETLLRALSQSSQIPIQIVVNRKQLGRFRSRYLGAKLAESSNLLFIDSRVRLTTNSAVALCGLPLEYKALSGHIEIDETKNVFCLYWLRTHARIFYRNFQHKDRIIKITPANFDEYVTGTGIFFVDKEIFLRCCKELESDPMHSDDTRLLQAISQLTPIIVHPSVAIEWEPRSELWPFLKRLFDRGPGFAEYHVFEKRGWLFNLLLVGMAGLIAILFLLVTIPSLAALIFSIGILVMSLSTLFFTKSAKEFFLLAPLHVMSLLVYGFGALNGIRVVALSRYRGPSKN